MDLEPFVFIGIPALTIFHGLLVRVVEYQGYLFGLHHAACYAAVI